MKKQFGLIAVILLLSAALFGTPDIVRWAVILISASLFGWGCTVWTAAVWSCTKALAEKYRRDNNKTVMSKIIWMLGVFVGIPATLVVVGFSIVISTELIFDIIAGRALTVHSLLSTVIFGYGVILAIVHVFLVLWHFLIGLWSNSDPQANH